mmetsp:Transcript_11333/g.14929  ORF Transcript_11333/g.14929 Transcript_11333/m.14929 type:complete len:211 (+) Transcript_11333:168-800(+)|eukprot:CAMPEP_0198143636 /NCGR_PEP_ID=MMETSP1443-20131203/8581_1 /TAXON_ID=186043 /ORGANISM="Entomoneis sp., Strain CCMP2396" /LENGTH=210 /DNA_ID=CAMNT_0043806901 /DNA_START=105 /DNA_END=737 /DNA_ORIENTATION=-
MMLLSAFFLSCMGTLVSGFSLQTGKADVSTKLEASRRDLLDTFALAAAGSVLIGGANAAQATPEVDYSKMLDLLGTSETTEAYQPTQAGKRPTYLSEPTEEFKRNEARASEFKREQLKFKREFATILAKMETDPNDESKLAGNMDEMRRFVKSFGGLPAGITKKDLITAIRRRKGKKFWPTNCEISYQDLLFEIQRQQSPNTEKDLDNPL